MIGWIAYLVLVLPLWFLAATGRALANTPLTIGLQVAGLALIVWARVTFGWRSFHAGSNPTEGGLVTSGPYRFVRNPIYAGVLLMFAGAIAAHPDLPAFAAGAVAFAAIGVRIASEEKLVAAKYPDYAAYAKRTRRLIPFVF